MANPRKVSYYPIIVGGVLLALLPLLNIGPYVLHILIVVFIFGILAISWDLLAGYAGQLSFGHAGFFGLGAYGTVLLVEHTAISAWAALFIGGLISMAFGMLVAVPCLRLRGPFLALTTLAFAEVLRVVCTSWVDFTGGPLGLSGYRSLSGIPLTREAFYYIALLLFAIVAILVAKIINSKMGLRFMAIRDDDILARVIGYNTTLYKIIAFMLSAYIAGIAGAFYGLYILVISPMIFDISITVLAISMVVIGGKGTLYGPVLGAFLIQFFSEYFRAFGGYRLVLVGIVTIIIVVFFPGGIWQLVLHVWNYINPTRLRIQKMGGAHKQ